MVSSTNGQVVSDATGSTDPNTPQSLIFVPCDNGTYTFAFTVTDSHGASDTEEVVVTVLNVSPVVTAPSISNQPNVEFILPVVHDVSFEGMFTDAGSCDTHTAVRDWGDGTTSDGEVTETDGSRCVTSSHTYALPGDYSITLTVTDDDGGSNSNIMAIHIADVERRWTYSMTISRPCRPMCSKSKQSSARTPLITCSPLWMICWLIKNTRG